MKQQGYNQEYSKEELLDRQRKGYSLPLNEWWIKMDNFNLEDLAERSMNSIEFKKFKQQNKDYKITVGNDGSYLCIHKDHLDTPLDYYQKGL